ncbi:hypothetical protein K438DRAFT_2010783 [Mycena galopus ATCC 62051]|nr:hypothetical protein K438DRAFT_2010783 [Mycena galopus ATCC 62051]
MLSPLARPALRQVAPALRQLHSTPAARSGHGDYNHLPFVAPFQGGKPATFALVLSGVLIFGFSIPFVAVQYQHAKKA